MRAWRSWLVAACLVVAACSDDNNGTPDAKISILDAAVTPDAAVPTPDAAVPTFAAQVIDLIEHQTADNTPAATVDFASADTEDATVFDSLF